MVCGRTDRSNNGLDGRVGRLPEERLKKPKRLTVYPLWGRRRRPHRASKREPGVGGREIAPGRLPALRDTPRIHHGEYPSTATTSSDDYHAWSRSAGVFGSSRKRFIHNAVSELRRITLPRTPMNRGQEEGPRLLRACPGPSNPMLQKEGPAGRGTFPAPNGRFTLVVALTPNTAPAAPAAVVPAATAPPLPASKLVHSFHLLSKPPLVPITLLF
jgi:hypothetical protein